MVSIKFVAILLFTICIVAAGQNRNIGAEDITPVPVENLDPHITEFRRVDGNNDESLSFSEFLLGDRPYIETQSRRFHQLDKDGNGRVTRKEYEDFFKDQDEHRHHRLHRDDFFKQIAVDLYSNDPTMHMPPLLLNFGPHNPQIENNMQQPKQKTSPPGTQPTIIQRNGP
ncbi:hypothetical protein DdX_03297 [Ditylenchus destructor]|uniref:EF-hand domain-containing protein n=1 Tax=Ditylenchus destructor TaxID=166010 RepID=A0AAD4NEB8_9BILA|nr:hypothetical protein DdX_03297 [Ditylenchus destructor]